MTADVPRSRQAGPQSLDKHTMLLTGAISIGSDGYVTAETLTGSTTTRTGVGEYTITLSNTYYQVKDIQLTFESASTYILIPKVVSHDVSTKTIIFTLNTVSGSTATPVDATQASTVFISILLKRTSDISFNT